MHRPRCLPELMRWARDRAKLKPEEAAKAAHVAVERLLAWESDKDNDMPTLGQLRNLAAAYHFPLAVFYLPQPPLDLASLRDFRRLPDAVEAPISANLALHIRSAYERRELAVHRRCMNQKIRTTLLAIIGLSCWLHYVTSAAARPRSNASASLVTRARISATGETSRISPIASPMNTAHSSVRPSATAAQ